MSKPAAPDAKGDAKVVVVMPARNAARTLERTFGAIPPGWVDEVLLVDDASTDDTVERARELPIELIWHPHNVGYGGNQKTCYLHALQRGADVVVMLHPDGQYEPSLLPTLVAPIIAGEADVVLGSRFLQRGGPRAGGMPVWKRAANRFLTGIENRVLGARFSELHTGYRAYSRDVLMTIPFLRNAPGFAFDSEVIFQVAHFGFRVHEVPVRTIYDEEASSVGFRAGVVYGLGTLRAAARYALHRRGVLPSRLFRP